VYLEQRCYVTCQSINQSINQSRFANALQ